MTKTIVLMRHGKSGYPEGTPDHDRPLAERGQREAGLAGQWITEHIGTVDAVLCSTATRTRETLTATKIDAPVTYEERLYGASPEEIIDEIALTDDAVSTLLVVGHAPGIPFTALELGEATGSQAAIEIGRKFPTSAIAVITFDTPWSELGRGTGELTNFHVPR
ncbi:SixA phosphatase family protein [Rhodococcoides kyotonense]|uniref:Phosphohistidine phosphatase n=1 Tax=Rhodococcoides kyotonense TaxID=398843 RepID=A0A239MLZ9_9NOCA|nr:histidine phosphatase family protein [Rhodococcus kyotonensis]SNT43114.1 phosphohistidine phosphatase [Rhodococcus kyotonensis]